MKGLNEALREVEGDLVEAWYRFQPLRDLAVMEELKEFVINEYNQAEKTIHVDYDNLVITSVKLPNSYIVVEHHVFMNPKDFDIKKGIDICKEKILNKLLEIYHPVEIKNLNNLKKFSTKSE